MTSERSFSKTPSPSFRRCLPQALRMFSHENSRLPLGNDPLSTWSICCQCCYLDVDSPFASHSWFDHSKILQSLQRTQIDRTNCLEPDYVVHHCCGRASRPLYRRNPDRSITSLHDECPFTSQYSDGYSGKARCSGIETIHG